MSRKSLALYLLAVVFLVAGAWLVFREFAAGAANRDRQAKTAAEGRGSVDGREKGADRTDGGKPGKRRGRERQRTQWAELEEKYGASRTGQARNVVGLLVEALDDSVAKPDGGPFKANPVMIDGLSTALGLSPAQQTEVARLFADHEAGKVGAGKVLATYMKERPHAMAEFLLVGDAKIRGELDESGYKDLASDALERMEEEAGVSLRATQAATRHDGQPTFVDPRIRERFEALLSPAQLEAWKQTPEGKIPANPNLSGFPPIELEKLEAGLTGLSRKLKEQEETKEPYPDGRSGDNPPKR